MRRYLSGTLRRARVGIAVPLLVVVCLVAAGCGGSASAQKKEAGAAIGRVNTTLKSVFTSAERFCSKPSTATRRGLIEDRSLYLEALALLGVNEKDFNESMGNAARAINEEVSAICPRSAQLIKQFPGAIAKNARSESKK